MQRLYTNVKRAINRQDACATEFCDSFSIPLSDFLEEGLLEEGFSKHPYNIDISSQKQVINYTGNN